MKKYLILTILGIFMTVFGSALKLNNQPVWCGQYISLLFVMFLAVPFVLWGFNRWLAILIGVCILSAFFTTKMNPRALILLWQVSLGSLASYGISKFKPKYRMAILLSIISIVVIQLSWLVIQYFRKDPFFHPFMRNINMGCANPIFVESNRMVGFSGSSDQLGTFFALTFPVILYIFPLLSILSIIGLCVSKSSFAFASFAISVLIYYYFTNRKTFKILLASLIILTTIFISYIDKVKMTEWGCRFGVWIHATKSLVNGNIAISNKGKDFNIICNPIFGYGLGNFQNIFINVPRTCGIKDNSFFQFNYEGEVFSHAHNDYVELLFELGYLGMITLFGLIANFIYKFYKSKKNKELALYFSCIMAYLLNAMGNFLSNIAVSGILLIVFFGLYEAVRRELNGANTKLV